LSVEENLKRFEEMKNATEFVSRSIFWWCRATCTGILITLV
jgi:hypothetical protein